MTPAGSTHPLSPLEITSSAPSAIGTSHLIVARPLSVRTGGGTGIDPTALYPSEPAPIGLADFGVGANMVPYTYSTTEILANVSWTSENIYNDSLGTTAEDLFTWQENAFMNFTDGGKPYSWWIQDVATYDTKTSVLDFMDCVWNATSGSATVATSGTVTGNGSVSGGVYSNDANNGQITTGKSASFELIIKSALATSGHPVVYLGYKDADTGGNFAYFDTVTFVWTKDVNSLQNFVIDGYQYNNWGLPQDMEITTGGPYNGDFTVAHATTDVTYQIYYWNGHNFEMPPATWNFGSETAESISEAQTFFSNDGSGTPQDVLWNGTAHDATTGPTYNQTQVGELSISAPSLTSGIVTVDHDKTSFTGGGAYLTLVPGSYNVWVNGSSNNFLGVCTIVAATNYTVSVPGTCSGGISGPTISSFTALPSVITLGGTDYLNVSASGGTGPLSYSYVGLPSPCTSSNSSAITCAPAAKGSYNVTVTVTDSAAHSTSAKASFTVNAGGSSGPTISAFTALPSTIPLGGTTYLNVSANGGTGTLTYSYSGLPSPCASSNASKITCAPSASGPSTVTVTVTDSLSRSTTAMASFTVNPATGTGPTISSFTFSPNPDGVGNTTVGTVAVSGGKAPLSYTYSSLPSGCSGTTTPTVTCTPTVAGTYPVTVTVTDANSDSATKSVNLVVTSSTITPLAITAFTANPANVSWSWDTVLEVTTSGGRGPLTYVYTHLPPGCSSLNESSLSCSPTASGHYNATVEVSDSSAAREHAWANVSLYVEPAGAAFEITSFRATPNPVIVGEVTKFNVSTTGGDGWPAFIYSGLPSGCSSIINVFNCTPTQVGTYAVHVNASISSSSYANAWMNLTVVGVPAPLKVTSFTANPSPATQGQSVQFTVVVTGGDTPFNYTYWANGSGCALGNSATPSCSPSASGTFTVSVIVTDVLGTTAEANLSLAVNPSSSAPPTYLGLSETNFLLLLVILVLVVAVVLAVVVRSRKPPAPPPPEYVAGPNWGAETQYPTASPPPEWNETPPP